MPHVPSVKGPGFANQHSDLPRDIFDEFRAFARDGTRPMDGLERPLPLKDRDTSNSGDGVDEETLAAI